MTHSAKSAGRLAATFAAVIAALTLAACGSNKSGGSDGNPKPATIAVTIKAGTVTPNGDRITVEHGQDVKLIVTADQAGEIHVHSEPEQEFSYDAGTTTLTIIHLDQPGVVDVESHTLDKVIVQLEVK